jgi:hypothetical protein
MASVVIPAPMTWRTVARWLYHDIVSLPISMINW